MRILFVGKRFYTNRDALKEHYGRIYQLPYYWNQNESSTVLWLVDYHTTELIDNSSNQDLPTISTPVKSWAFIKQVCRTLFMREARPTILVASGDCYLGLMAWFIAKWTNARFIFDIYDRYDEFDGYRRALWWDPLSFLRDKADVCFFASSIVRDALGGVRATDLVVVNGIDTHFFRPLDITQCRRKFNLIDESLLIGYFGSMESDRGVNDLYDAVTILRDEGLAIQLIVAGKRDASTDLDRPNIIYLGNVPYLEMPHLMGCCDVLALPYRRSKFMDAGASNKIIEYLAVGKPIAATRTPNLINNFIGNSSFAECTAEPGDSVSLSEVIKKMIDSPDVLPVPAGFSWDEVAERALQHINFEFRDE